MAETLLFEKTNDECLISKIMLELSSCFFDQTINDKKKIEILAQKFARFANFYYCKSDDVVVGYVVFYSNDSVSNAGYLSIIIVREDYRNRGIGNKFMSIFQEDCISAGMTSLHLEVNKQNDKAIAMYKNLGFAIEKNNETTYIMGKELENS